MKKIVFIFSAIIIIIPLYSQSVPGYQGKKLHVNAGVSLSPLTGVFYHWEEFGNFLPKFNVDAHYTLGRSGTLGANFDYRTEFILIQDYIFDGNQQPAHNTMMSVGLSYRHYAFKTSGSIAPLGIYALCELKFLNSVIADSVKNSSGKRGEFATYSTVYLSLGMGRQYIIFDKGIIDFGVKIGLSPRFFNFWSGEKELFLPIDVEADQRLYANYFINFYLNIGILVY